MERPDLKRMLKAIERRQANLVITKDLSRLGRNYLQTGFLIEDFFPRHGVRYIAMNDGIDTMRDNNDIAPFKNILNAVSYTHLDVYKRQLQHVRNKGAGAFAWAELSEIHCHHKKPKGIGGRDKYENLVLVLAPVHELIHAIDAVSYTHLDGRLLQSIRTMATRG